MFSQIWLRDDGTILSSTCECPRGEYKCSHAAAVAIHAIHNISATDVACQWSKPSTSKAPPQEVSELYPQLSEVYNPLTRDVTSEDVDWFRSSLQGTQCGMAWLLAPEPQSENMSIPTVPQLVQEKKGQGLEAILASMTLTEEQRSSIQTATMGQRRNPQWQLYRQGRLTASNFGAVLQSRRATPCQSLMKRVLEGYQLDGVLAVNWGIVNEPEGVKAFKLAYQKDVQQCGLYVTPSGVLGASPDGLVEPDALLEVKCPYSHRNGTISEATSSPSFCLREAGGSYELREGHPYWHQVQGQLHITGRSLCYFVVWTTKEAIVIPIPKDPLWSGNVSVLETFYHQHMLPVLASVEEV